jgi:transposase
VLKVCGHDVLVANPRKIRLITESDRKSDRVDAESLARLARADRLLLAPIQHRTQEKQVQLSVIRARHVLVRTRTALINCARGLVKPMGLRLPASSAEAFAKRAAAISLPELLRVALGPLLKQVEAVIQAIRDYDRQIEQIAATQYPETCLLKQIKGVGTLISLTYVLTLEDPHRFAKSRDVGAFLGFLPREKQSGERAPRLGISRAGNEYLRTLLVQGAHYILGPLGPDTDLRRWGLQLAARGGGGAKKRAVTAVARKLSVLLHHFWKTGEVYVPAMPCSGRLRESLGPVWVASPVVRPMSRLQRPSLHSDPNMHRATKCSSRVRIEAGRNAEEYGTFLTLSQLTTHF